MNIVLTGFCGYVALAVIIFCIFYTMVRAGMDLHDMWILRKWRKNNKDKQQLIDDACEWLEEYAANFVALPDEGQKPIGDTNAIYGTKSLLYYFRKAMED